MADLKLFDDLPRVRDLALSLPRKADRDELNAIADRWHALSTQHTDRSAEIIERLETALTIIARDFVNVGRRPGAHITAQEYAAEALRHSGIKERAAPPAVLAGKPETHQ